MHARMMGCGCSREAGAGECAVHVVPLRRHGHHYQPPIHEGSGGGSPFGVRRPLRFLAWKLGLAETQITGFAGVLNELKTERAQAEVDDRRALSRLADLVEAESFDAEAAAEVAKLRAQSAEKLQREVARAVQRIHGLLEAGQRQQFAYLIRTGAVLL